MKNSFCASCGKPLDQNTKRCLHCDSRVEDSQSSPLTAPTNVMAMPSLLIDRESLLARDMTAVQQIAFLAEMNHIRKDPKTAFWWAFWLGGLGAQHFYLGNTGRAVLYLLFFWTSIPAIVSFVELFTIKQKVRSANDLAAFKAAEKIKLLMAA